MSETGGELPIDVTGFFAADGASGSIQANFTVVDPGTYSDLRATVYLYDNNVAWCCGYGGEDTWHETVRVCRSSFFSLDGGVGDDEVVIESFDIDPSWNIDELHAVAVIQYNTGNQEMIQGGRLVQVTDFSLDMAVRVASVPESNGEALFVGSVENVSDTADVIGLSVGSSLTWSTDFQIEGDPTWYTTTDLNLAPDESKGITIRVQTDGVQMIGSTGIEVASANSGRAQPVDFRVFNGSHAILFVDDDADSGYEQPFEDALNNLGYLYDDWDAAVGHGGSGPRTGDLLGFDAVVWHTAYRTSDLMTDDDMTAMTAYLDYGGAFFLSSMDVLSNLPAGGPDFISTYLGVDSYSSNTKSEVADGVGGDPITDGMNLDLVWPASGANRSDTIEPTATASTIFYSEDLESTTLRNEAASFKTVFTTICHHAISTTDADPNNSETFIDNVLNWLLDRDTTDAPELNALTGSTSLVGASPNPFSGATEVRFFLGQEAASGAVELTVVDASGRMVRELVNDGLESGYHTVAWDGRDNAGHDVPIGMYFARLSTVEGLSSDKLTLVR